MDEQIRKLKELVDGSDNIVFFGGAGHHQPPAGAGARSGAGAGDRGAGDGP